MATGAMKYKPFKFERSFDTDSAATQRRKDKETEAELQRQAEAALEEELPPPPPTFSEEELQAAKAIAFEEGHAAGLSQAKQELENHVVAALHTITGQLAVLHDRQALANEVTAAELAKITREMIAKLLPYYTEKHGADEIASLVKTCLEPLEDTGRVTIKVSPDIQEAMKPRLEQAKVESGFRGELVVLADASLGPADVQIDWGQGGAERNTEKTWRYIDEAVGHALSQGDAHAGELAAPPAPDMQANTLPTAGAQDNELEPSPEDDDLQAPEQE